MTSSSTPVYFQQVSPAATSASTPHAPQSSALPPSDHVATNDTHRSSAEPEIPSVLKIKPQRKPLLRLELRDLSSEGSRAFLRLLDASSAVEIAVDTVLCHLYRGIEASCIPPTRSVTLVLRSMDGVAYTTGLDIDDDHKEIHLNTKYIERIPLERQRAEIEGVLVHEMVHCWQHHGSGTAPGGLTEGVADWVRLKAGYAPPHWKRHGDCEWDAGYERTAYFLEWLEKAHGADVVRRINQALRGCRYDADKLWKDCCGKHVEELWKEYKTSLQEGGEKSQDMPEKKSENAQDGGEEKTGKEQRQEEHATPTHDERTAREKARRGGNMMVPVRPGTT
jgi:hypothetical protein